MNLLALSDKNKMQEQLGTVGSPTCALFITSSMQGLSLNMTLCWLLEHIAGFLIVPAPLCSGFQSFLFLAVYTNRLTVL